MSLDLSELTLIRLQTELENAIGFREHYLKHYQETGNIIFFIYWDTEMHEIIEEIIRLGE